MCAIEGPVASYWQVWELIPPATRTESEQRFGITHRPLACGAFSTQERAQMFLNNWQKAIDHPERYKIEETELDWRLRCH